MTGPGQHPESHNDPAPDPDPHAGRRFRRTLVSVMTVQVVTLLLLWWLQRSYTP